MRRSLDEGRGLIGPWLASFIVEDTLTIKVIILVDNLSIALELNSFEDILSNLKKIIRVTYV